MINALVAAVKSLNIVTGKMLKLAKNILLMKLFSFLKLSVVISLIVLIGSCCDKGGGVEPDYPIYNYTTDIVNPPARFQVVYIVNIPGDKTANITFETNSVWVVEKLGDSRVLYTINNGSDKKSIIHIDTIGFEGGKLYKFTANNSTILDITNFLTEHNLTNLDYDTFGNNF